MIGYRLCTVRPAKHPFFVESIAVNLYTVEELCYFLYKNMYLVDETIVSDTLTRWIAEELGLGETALKMEQALKKSDSLSEFLLPLFQDTRYLEPVETRLFQRALDSLSSGPAWVRLKKKADALAQNARFGEAQNSYYLALKCSEEQKNSEEMTEFRAAIWYCLGSVCMQLFEYEDGCSAFLKAVRLSEHEAYRLAYLKALKLTLPSEKYEARLEELRSEDLWTEMDETLVQQAEHLVDEALRQLAAARDGDAEEMLQQVIREYRNAARQA